MKAVLILVSISVVLSHSKSHKIDLNPSDTPSLIHDYINNTNKYLEKTDIKRLLANVVKEYEQRNKNRKSIFSGSDEKYINGRRFWAGDSHSRLDGRRSSKKFITYDESDSSSRELKNWKDEWRQIILKKKIEAINATQKQGDVVNMLAARPWGRPCGDLNQFKMLTGSCVLPGECDGEYRIYRGDHFCGQTTFVCCSVQFTTYDLYQGLDMSLGSSNLKGDSAEELDKKRRPYIEAYMKKLRDKKHRIRLRAKKKRQIRDVIRKIVREVRLILNKAYHNGSKSKRKKTRTMKKFIRYLKQQYRMDRDSAKELHETELFEVDDELMEKLLQIKDVNNNFMTNDTFRNTIINKAMNLKTAHMLMQAYPELDKFVSGNVLRHNVNSKTQTKQIVPRGEGPTLDIKDIVHRSVEPKSQNKGAIESREDPTLHSRADPKLQSNDAMQNSQDLKLQTKDAMQSSEDPKRQSKDDMHSNENPELQSKLVIHSIEDPERKIKNTMHSSEDPKRKTKDDMHKSESPKRQSKESVDHSLVSNLQKDTLHHEKTLRLIGYFMRNGEVSDHQRGDIERKTGIGELQSNNAYGVTGHQLSQEANHPSRYPDQPSWEANHPSREVNQLRREANHSRESGNQLSQEANHSSKYPDHPSWEANHPSREVNQLSREANHSRESGNQLIQEANHSSKYPDHPSWEANHPSREVNQVSREANHSRESDNQLNWKAPDPCGDANQTSLEANRPSGYANKQSGAAVHAELQSKNAGGMGEVAGEIQEDARGMREDAGRTQENATEMRDDIGGMREDAGEKQEDARVMREDVEGMQEDARGMKYGRRSGSFTSAVPRRRKHLNYDIEYGLLYS